MSAKIRVYELASELGLTNKELLEQYNYTGCLVLHGLHEESEFAKAVSFINGVFGEAKA